LRSTALLENGKRGRDPCGTLRSAYEIDDALQRCNHADVLALALWGEQPIQDEVAIKTEVEAVGIE